MRILQYFIFLSILTLGCQSINDTVSSKKTFFVKDLKIKELPNPHFNKLHKNEAIFQFMREYAAAMPEMVSLKSLGKSTGERDILMMTINNPHTGNEMSKPAMYVDGAIHANEAQTSGACLYIINYLLQNYGKLDEVTKLLDRVVFYIIPIVSPDSRSIWFEEPSNPHHPRTVQVPRDDDRDGLIDEDGYEDLDGNGTLTIMRKKVKMGEGRFKLDPKDSRRMIAVKPGEEGDYLILGYEGIDNDGDGVVNEDAVGNIDPNRCWGYNWQPHYIQYGTCDYPLQIPEVRCIGKWLVKHQNVAGCQSFHNSGGWVLRGPGSKHEKMPAADVRVHDYLGKKGEKLLPGYLYGAAFDTLYPAYGVTFTHFYGVHGIVSFTNELNAEEDFFKYRNEPNGYEKKQIKKLEKNDKLAYGRMFVPWKKYQHPQYGEIEIGGYRQDAGRVSESWKLEEDYHRNAAFVLLHAKSLPHLEFLDMDIKQLEGGQYEIKVDIQNKEIIPTMTDIAIQDKLHRKDVVTIDGAKVVASGVVSKIYPEKISLQKHRPERLLINGIKGNSFKRLYFIVEGSGAVEIVYNSLKGGVVKKKIQLSSR